MNLDKTHYSLWTNICDELENRAFARVSRSPTHINELIHQYMMNQRASVVAGAVTISSKEGISSDLRSVVRSCVKSLSDPPIRS